MTRALRSSLMSAAALLVSAAPAFAGEIAIQNMDGAPFPDRLVMNDMGINGRSLPVHDSAVLRVRNAGTTPLVISGLATTGPFSVSGATAPATLDVGSSLDLRVRYDATGPGSPDAWRHDGTLRITSDDPDRPVLTVELAGLWQDRPEGSNERTLEQIIDVFGYRTTITSAGQRLGNNGRVQQVGDEVLSPYWKRPDVSEPVTVRQIVSFRDPIGTPVDWYPKGSPPPAAPVNLPPLGSYLVDTPLMDTRPDDQQTLFPRLVGSTTPATVTFAPTSALFGLQIEDALSDPELNPRAPACNALCGHVIRAWPAEDRSGAPIPATYLIALDHMNDDASGNYDYQDAVYVVENVVPEATPTDTVPPAIASRTPAPGATGVPSDSPVRVTFTEPVDADSVNGGTATISAAGRALPATVEATGSVVTIDPAGLVAGASHTVRLSQITDTSGNAIPTTTWTFTAAGAGGGGTPAPPVGGAGSAGVAPTAAQAAGAPAPPPAADPAGVAAAARCAPVRTRRAASAAGPVRLDAAGLTAIRRTTQAALRRITAVERRLGQGLTARDLCGGSFTAGKFAAGVVLATGGPGATDVPRPRTLRIGGASGGRVQVTPAALAALRRDARAALRRLDVLERRLDGGLTGADLAPGALTSAKLAPGLVVVSATGPEPAPTRVRAAGAVRTVRVPLTAAQVRSTRRLADAALRRADALVARLEAGVPGRSFRDGSVGPRAIAG